MEKRLTHSGSAAISIGFDLEPVHELMKKIEEMESIDVVDALENKVFPKALGFLVQQAKVGSPVFRGLLRESMAYKIVRYENNKCVVGVLGADQSVSETVTRRSRKNVSERIAQKNNRKTGTKKGDLLRARRAIGEYYVAKIRPSKYFHLVESGHALKGGKGTQPGTFFFKQAMEAGKEEVMNIFRNELTQIYEEAIRGN